MPFPFSNFSFRSYPLVWNSTSPIRGYRCTVPLRYLDFKTVSDVYIYVCNVRECIHACVHVYLAITLLGISPLFWQEGNSLGENVALLSLFARIYRLSYEEENFGREIFDFEVVCGKFLQSLERSCCESRRKESLEKFQISIWTRILLEFCERMVDSREAKLFELSSRAFWTFPLIGGGIGLARGRSIKCRILCQRGRGRCNVFNVRRSSTIPPCLPW